MSYNKLLQRQIKKFLPEALQNQPEIQQFLTAIKDSYKAYERDKELSERAFRISEEEYIDINNKLVHEVEVRKLSVEKLKEVVGIVTGEETTNNTNDLLMITRYLNQQVNKRKNAEKVFTSLINNMQSGILLEDETRHITFANQLFCDLFSIPVSPELLQGADCSNSAEQSKHLFKNPQKFCDDIATLLAKKELVTAELLEMADGRILERDYIPIFLDKKYQGHLWQYTDVTETQRAHDAIAKSELNNRLILNAGLDAIVIIDEAGIITFWNPQAEKIFGWKAEEVIHKQLSETIVPERHIENHKKGLAHFLATGEGPILNKIMELTALNKNNEEIPVELSITPIKRDTGIAFCSFIRDISERKKAELELKASQEIWQFALEGAGDGVWEYDFETKEVFFSKQYKKMLGYNDDEFKNEPEEWLNKIHPDDLAIIESTDIEYLENKIDAHKREYRIKHKSGNYMWVLDRGMVVNYTAEGKPKRIIGTHTDITGRRKAEEEYRHISVVASANANGVIFTEADGKISWNNEGYSKITGFSKDEIIGKTPLDLGEGPLSKSEALVNMVAAFMEGRNFNVELIHYKKDTSWFWARITGQAILGSDGKVAQYFAIIEDISQQKKQEEEFRSLAENIPGVLYRYEYNQNGKEGLVYISPDAETKIGISGEQFADFYNYMHPDDIKREKEATQLARQKKMPYHFEGRFLLPDKPLIWLNISSSYLNTTQDGTMISTGIIINTTKVKEAELALQIKEEKYRSIIANMNLGLMEVDTNENILFVNQSFCDMCGYTEAELLGKKASLLFARGENSELMEVKNEMRKKGISDAYEISIQNKRGEVKWWLISGAPRFNDNGELTGSIGIHLDITEQKNLEYELQEAREMAELSANAKQQFLANMSHEIRTPMNAIMGMSNQLGKTSLNTQQQFYLDTIHSASDNLLVIINDILDLSKIEAGKLSLENIGFEAKTVVRKALQVFIHKAEEKGLHLTNSEFDPAIASVLIGDPYRLNQILINLLGNAIKFTEKGTIDVAVKVIEDIDDMQTIFIQVKDTGIGMDDKFVDHLFDKFSQEYQATTRKYGGTGLGMSICRELIDLMGGKIRVQSKKGEGTTVSFMLTCKKGSVKDIPVKETGIADIKILEGKNILVTDDNEMNRLVAAIVLSNYGATVVEAENGQEAVDKLQTEHIDLVLMDIQMPVLNGFEATQIIRTELKSKIPIIALTANAIRGENEKCIGAGMNDYISKPFNEDDFVATIARWLGKEVVITTTAEQKAAGVALFKLDQLHNISRGNQVFIKKMIDLFVQQAPAAVQEIKEAYKINDFAKIKAVAHKMKPSIDNLEIALLTADIRQIEALAAQEKRSEEMDILIHKLEQVIDKVVTEIKLI